MSLFARAHAEPADVPSTHANHLLLAEILRFDAAANTSALARRIAVAGWDALLAEAEGLRLRNVVAERAPERGLVPPLPALQLPDGRLTLPAALAALRDSHRTRRQAQRQRLLELVRALNAAGIEPLLLKGARSLWTGAPASRSMRDLDLLVPRDRLASSQQLALRMGYAETNGPSPIGIHHDANLFRDDLPGWIEFHAWASVPRIECLLGTDELAAASLPVSLDGATARILPAELHILHGMLHHHIGHHGDRDATIALKALYEFASEVQALDAASRARTLRRAGRHPRLLAILDLWLAAAADALGLAIQAPFVLAEDARELWFDRKPRGGEAPSPDIDGRPAETALALAPARLARVDHPLLRHRLAAWAAIRASYVHVPRLRLSK